MLLPETCSDSFGRAYYLAYQEGHIAGAVSFRDDGTALSGVRVHVIDSMRRQRLGTELVEWVYRQAVTKGRQAIRANSNTLEETGAESFLVANGFTSEARLFTFEAEIEDFHRRLSELSERLMSGGHALAEARIVGLPEAPIREVADIYAEYIANLPELPQREIDILRDRELFRCSQVLLVGNRVKGMLITRMDAAGVPMVHARVVTSAYQGSAANALLLAKTTAAMLVSGATRVRFQSLHTNRDTLKLAQRLRARTVRIDATFVRSVRCRVGDVIDAGPKHLEQG
jgi:GNAT superfamily N-acetyltransferase